MKQVVIASHIYTYGKSQAFRDYLLGKARVSFIGHSIFGNLINWFFDVVDLFIKSLKIPGKIDVFFGSNNLNTAVGILLKFLYKVKFVIYYTPDSPPNRFQNKFINHIYRKIDLFCVKHSDITWNNSNKMIQLREQNGLSQKFRVKQIEVPMGTDEVKKIKTKLLKQNHIIFVGGFTQTSGIVSLIKAMKYVNQINSKIKLTIVGSGEKEKEIISLISQYNLKNITIYKPIIDIKKIYRFISKFSIAIAPYPKQSHINYCDSGKIKLYLSAHLPVITTRSPSISNDIVKYKCGLVCDYEPNKIAASILKLFKNKKQLSEFKKNTSVLIDKYSYDRLFTEALKKSGIILV